LYLAELAVDKAYKGRNIGSKLVKAAVHFARRMNRPIFVRTNEHSVQLHKFYERCGFLRLEHTAFQEARVKKRCFICDTNKLNGFKE